MGQALAMKLPIHQIDAFTSDVFKGNYAAVIPLEAWLPGHHRAARRMAEIGQILTPHDAGTHCHRPHASVSQLILYRSLRLIGVVVIRYCGLSVISVHSEAGGPVPALVPSTTTIRW